jgi:FtsH-binding integral membrane protein
MKNSYMYLFLAIIISALVNIFFENREYIKLLSVVLIFLIAGWLSYRNYKK